MFFAATCFAQTAEVKTDDLKAIRGSLERLVQLTQEIDKNERALLAVQQMQLYESRLQVLESRDDVLTEREAKLSASAGSLERRYKDADPSIGPTGVPGRTSDASIRSPMGEELQAALRILGSVREKKQQVEHEIADLRARMEALHAPLISDSAR